MSKTQMQCRRVLDRIALLTTIGALLMVFVVTASAQQNVWTANYERRENISKTKAATRQSFPAEFRLFDLNVAPLRQQLFSIVDSGFDITKQRSIVISVPNAD